MLQSKFAYKAIYLIGTCATALSCLFALLILWTTALTLPRSPSGGSPSTMNLALHLCWGVIVAMLVPGISLGALMLWTRRDGLRFVGLAIIGAEVAVACHFVEPFLFNRLFPN